MIGQLLKLMAIKEGHQCEAVFSVAEGLEFLQREPVDIIFLDVLLPEGNGINSIPPILNSAPETDIVMLTGESSTQYIEKAFKAGATDYLIKPVNLERFSKVVGSLIKLKRKNNVQRQISREEIIGDSAKIKQCIEKVAQSSLGDANVLIQGETGTGKELFAKAIHANSGRAKNKYIIVDCTNLPVNLAESLLFGHDRGSFTGAEKAKKGLFELAHNGTIFLDEIGDLDLAIQKSLLRVLQEKNSGPCPPPMKWRAISAWWRPPTGTSRPWFIRGPSARISIFVCRPLSSACLHSGSGRATLRGWWTTTWGSSARKRRCAPLKWAKIS